MLTSRPHSSPRAEGVVYGFFDDQSGARIGRLQIARISVGYQRNGFLKLAWRPVALLEGVKLDIGVHTRWPAAGQQIIRALSDGGRAGSVLREVQLVVEGPSRLAVLARQGRLRDDGGLELTDATILGDGPPPWHRSNYCFWLAGPDAGRLMAIPAEVARAENPGRSAVSTAGSIEK